MKLLPVKSFQQSESMCGPASLKMVFEYYGVRKSEKELARMAGSSRMAGTKAEGLMQAARVCGFTAQIKDNASFGDIAKLMSEKKPVVVDWFSTDEGHYSVVVGIDQKNIYLQDPEINGIRKIERQTFQRVWFDFEGKYIKSPRDIVLRRMIVVTPQKGREKRGE